MSKLELIDARNYFRKILEVGGDVRSIFTQFITPTPQTAKIIVWDGAFGSQRRKAIYPDYKKGRTPLRPDTIINFEMIQKVLTFTTAHQVCCQDYEADDVIAALTRHYAALNQQITIFSNDADFLQLVGEYPNNVKCGASAKVEPSKTRLYKLTVGDSSDKIIGVRGFGEGAWEQVDHDQLEAWMQAALNDQPLPEFEWPSRAKPDIDLLKKQNQILEFFPVHMDEINQNFTPGVPNIAGAEAFFQEYLL